MPQTSSFDAFFDAVTQSRDFSHLSKGDPMMQIDLQTSQELLQETSNKIAEAIPEPAKQNKSIADGGSNTSSQIHVQYFSRIEGKPFGFEAVAGMSDLKSELQESFIKPLKFKFLFEKLTTGTLAINDNDRISHLRQLAEEYAKFQVSIPTGMLFYGPPGTGKTFITKKLAEELGCGLIIKNMGEFGSSYLHQTTKNIKDFFSSARALSETEPLILFLDEIDSLVSKRGHNADANKAEEVSQFLQEFNALEDAKNLIVIAATNRPDHLDSAILRSGRLDKKIYLGPPDASARQALFEMYIHKKGRPNKDLDYTELAHLSAGYVSADIEAICDEAARDASHALLELIDEAESATLSPELLLGHSITMELLKGIIKDMPSSLNTVDMTVYHQWIEKL